MNGELVWATGSLAAAAAPAGVVVALLARRGLGRARRPAAWGAAVARGAAVALALLAAARPTTVERSPTAGVVHVARAAADVSEMKADRVLAWADGAPPRDEAAAASAAEALETLRAAAPAETPVSLVLAWPRSGDGSVDLGVSEALTERGADTFLLDAPDAARADAGASVPRIVAPASVVEGVEFRLVVESGDVPFAAGAATLSIDGHDEPVSLPAGARRVAMTPVSLSAGVHSVAITFQDRAHAALALRVAEPPSVLLVTTTGVEPPLASRLRAQGLRVRVTSEATADLAPPCDVVVLGPGTGRRSAADVASRLAAGSGLLVSGGEGTRGLSRLRGTAIEELLPVELPLPPEPPPAPPAPKPPEEKPEPPSPERPKPVLDEGDRRALRVALLLCIDRSWSMAHSHKMSMAKQAAIAAIRTLSTEDRVGVLAFNSDPEWIVRFRSARDTQAIWDRLERLSPQGGTEFLSALNEAYAALAAEDCGIRHLVFITDGEPNVERVYGDLVRAGAESGITLSAIGVGADADGELLGRLATWGRGRLYSAVNPEHLPEVITQDTKRFALVPRDEERERREAKGVAAPEPEQPDAAPPVPEAPPTTDEPKLAAEPRIPRVAVALPFLAGLEGAEWPRLAHPEAMRPRGPSAVPLTWDDGGAALVLGRASAGRVAVVAADVVSSEARHLWLWMDAGRFTAQLVRALAPAPPPAEAGPAVRLLALEDGRAAAAVASPYDGLLRLRPVRGGDEIRAICVASGGEAVAALDAVPARGVWVGEFTPLGGAPSQPVAVVSRGAPPRDDGSLAREIAARSGAELVSSLPAPRDGPPRERHTDRSAPLLLGAAFLLVADAALRRWAVA